MAYIGLHWRLVDWNLWKCHEAAASDEDIDVRGALFTVSETTGRKRG